MNIVCLDVEGVLVPEIWIEFSKASGIPELKRTTRDEPDYNKLMNWRLGILKEHGLGLKEIRTIHARAEELGRNKEHRARYDLVVSRAVANLSSLSEYCLPFVKTGGYFISYKSIDIDMEYNESRKAIHVLGGETDAVRTVHLPQTELDRSFVIVRKVSETPRAYPRKAGTPSKDPIK